MTTSFKDYVKGVEATLSDEEREMLDVFRAYYSTFRKRLATSEAENRDLTQAANLLSLDFSASEAARERAEANLRQEWWLNHGHAFSALYGDDGEMQCASCPCDFKRESIENLRAWVHSGRLARAARASTEEGKD